MKNDGKNRKKAKVVPEIKMFEDDDNIHDPSGFNTVVELESGGMCKGPKGLCYRIHTAR